MEIDKILFGQLSIGKIDKSFDELDINDDNVINQNDLDIANNYDIKNAINTLLNEIDEDSELIVNDNASVNLKTGAKKQTIQDILGPDRTKDISSRDGINVTDAANFQEDVINSKGVTYVVMGNLGNCSFCNELENALVHFKDELGEVANIYNMSWSSNTELCRDICYNQGGIKQPASFPQIAKFVDGKFDGIVDTHWMDFSYQTLENGKQRPVLYGDYSNNPNTRNKIYGTRPDIIDKLIKYSTETLNPTLKTDKNGLYQTDSGRFAENVEQSKGTTYVVMGSLDVEGGCGCTYCWDLYYSVLAAQDQLKGVANVFHMNWDTDADLCRKICREMGNVPYPATFPQIAKFVDGKFVEMLTNTRDYGTKDVSHATIQEMLAKAEGTPSLIDDENNANTSEAKETNIEATSTQESKVNEEKEKLKTEMNELKTQANKKEAEVMFLKSIAEKKEEAYEKFNEEFIEGPETEEYFDRAKLNALKTSSAAAQSALDIANNELFSLQTKYISVSQDYLDL